MKSQEIKIILRKIPGYLWVKRGYYFSSRVKHRLSNRFHPTARILLYHRIAEVKNDPYQLAVSPDNFREHLEYLRNHFRVVSLAQLANELKAKKIINHTVAITFDDGYADNWQNALPILKELNITATFFITVSAIDQHIPHHFFPNSKTAMPKMGNTVRAPTNAMENRAANSVKPNKNVDNPLKYNGNTGG